MSMIEYGITRVGPPLVYTIMCETHSMYVHMHLVVSYTELRGTI